MITIWSFHDAPDEYKALSRHGGDEDWIVFAESGHDRYFWPFRLGTVLGGYEDSYLDEWGHVDRHELSDGSLVIIFAHA